MPNLIFPRNFHWGVAAAAAQIEGAHDEDGKGESTWDHFARTSPTVYRNETPAVACDHYHRYREDAKLMQALGAKHYRLSVSWPRVIPDGTGAVNGKGLAFYDRLVDTLLEHGVTPWVTLFHWDTPQALELRGGWLNRAIVDDFARYTEVLVDRLGDRVKNWFTINETKCFTTYAMTPNADKAPGVARSAQQINQAIHHVNLAHGRAVQIIRARGGKGQKIGYAENLDIFVPLTETDADIAAARKLFVLDNAKILGAMSTGRYDPAWLKMVGKDRPVVERGDLSTIATPTDFCGLNVYSGTLVRAGKRGPECLPFAPEHPAFGTTKWLKVLPRSIYWALKFTHEVYGPKAIYITENGVGHHDEAPDANGEVIDTWRLEHYRAYLSEVHRAIRAKVPVKGYFAWSLMDNYEWADGYRTRFGMCYTDFATQRRIPKLSMRWYSQVMAGNRLI